MNGLAYGSATIGLVLIVATVALAGVKITLWLADVLPLLDARSVSLRSRTNLVPIRVRASRRR